jgi:DNA-binding IclR family transcriptional regulator
MIKALHKACDILELLAGSTDEPMPLGKIADRLGLNKGTCANILKTLITRGLAEQIAPRQGYLLGPLAYSLAALGPYRKDIVSAAEPAMANLAAQLKEKVVLATLQHGRRYVLRAINGNQTLQIRPDAPYLRDTYRMATGRLLLAHLSDAELAAHVAEHGLPGDVWPAGSTRPKMSAELKRIRKAGFALNQDTPDIVMIAVGILEDDKLVAALGVGLPSVRYTGENSKRVRDALKCAAREINKAMLKSVSDRKGT